MNEEERLRRVETNDIRQDGKIDEIMDTLREHDTRLESHDDEIRRHDSMIASLNESMAVFKEVLANMATKADILGLRNDISEQFNANLKDAHNSVPVRITLAVTVGMFLIALVGFVVNVMLMHHA